MTIIFPIEQYKKLRAYVENINYEISGLGKVRIVGDEIHVEEIRIFKQVVTAAETKIDAQALGKFYDELLQVGEDPGDWKLWWHSHCDFDAFFSGTDVATIADFDTEQPMDNWMVSLVTNHKGKSECRLDIFAPVRCTIGKIDSDISFDDPALENRILDEITEKVEIRRDMSMLARKKNTVSFTHHPRVGLSRQRLDRPRHLPLWMEWLSRKTRFFHEKMKRYSKRLQNQEVERMNNILILGAGALGSNLTRTLIPDLHGEHHLAVMDFDTVEERNVIAGTQFYTREQIGQKKVEALQFNVFKWFERDIDIISDKLTESNLSMLAQYQLIVDCFDNYQSRKLVQDSVQKLKIPCVHMGFSAEMTYAIEWKDNYAPPSDITSGMDICELPGAAGFVTMVAALGSLVVQEYMEKQVFHDFVGRKFSLTEIT
jgi:proteasome lid subunit RPN8/RPN11